MNEASSYKPNQTITDQTSGSNTGTSAAQAQLKFFDDNGNPLQMPLTILGTGATSLGTGTPPTASSVTQSIVPSSSLWIQSAAPATNSLLTGSAQLTTSGNVGGYAIFRYNTNGQEAVVPLESRTANSYVIAFDNASGTSTGIALNTVSSQSVNIPVTIRDDAGRLLQTSSIPLAANGHMSFDLGTQYSSTTGVRGTIEFATPPSASISVLGIRSPAALTFTTLPPLSK